LHCCFACAYGTATGENAATTQATNATDLICFVIIKDYSLLQSTYGDNQIGPFENFHQFGENVLVVLGSWFEVFLQYALRFVDGLKNQLLIGHDLLARSISPDSTQKKDQVNFWNYPINFCFKKEPERPKMPIRSREHLGSGGRELHVGSALMPQQPAFEIARASGAHLGEGDFLLAGGGHVNVLTDVMLVHADGHFLSGRRAATQRGA
jgi:hypothetical protein